MKTNAAYRMLVGITILATLALTGCGTPAAKDFRGSWTPVNQFRDKPVEIPLDQAYTFYAAPMDETLKTMLDRWARDTGRTLSYRLDFDVTLYRPVADIHTSDVHDAAAQLNKIYGAQDVMVIAHPREILVQRVGAPVAQDAAHANPVTSAKP